MSSETSLCILKNSRKLCLSDKYSSIEKKYKYQVKVFFNDKDQIDKYIPLYLPLNIEADEYDEFVNSKTLEIYSNIIDIQFCSTFVELAEYFSINSCKKYQIELNEYQVKLMLQAINYILDNRFDERFEQILNNEFIEIFGKNNRNYFLFKNREYEFDDDFDNLYSLKRFKTILDMFLLMCEESLKNDEYKLLFSYWG